MSTSALPLKHLVIHDSALDTNTTQTEPSFKVGQIVAVYPLHDNKESIRKAIRAHINTIAHYDGYHARNTFVYFMCRSENLYNGWANTGHAAETRLVIAPEAEVFAVAQPIYPLGQTVKLYDEGEVVDGGPNDLSEEEYEINNCWWDHEKESYVYELDGEPYYEAVLESLLEGKVQVGC